MTIRNCKSIMNTKTLPYKILVFTFVALFAATACQPTNTPTEQAVESPVPSASTQTSSANNPAAISSDLFLDPAITQDADSLVISQYLYEGLVVLDGDGQPQKGIAESWELSDDELDYIFTLRPGAVFSDGTPITPDIVVDNFNRWFDPKNPLHKDDDFATWETIFLGFLGEKDANDRAKSTVDGIQKVDSNTVLLHLNRPVPETLTYLANPAFAILNTKALADGNYGTQESQVISSGPYIVSSWTDAGLVLSPNAKYWGEIPTNDLTFTWR
jgi:peptide/nickel transport system substrate-binding protein